MWANKCISNLHEEIFEVYFYIVNSLGIFTHFRVRLGHPLELKLAVSVTFSYIQK